MPIPSMLRSGWSKERAAAWGLRSPNGHFLRKPASAKFYETIEIHVKLVVDPKQSDQNVRGTFVLPHGSGKSKRVVVVAKGEKVKEAEAAGADVAGEGDLIEK